MGRVKSLKNTMIVLLCFVILVLSGCGKDKQEIKQVTKTEAQSITVYITKTGECYHKSNCSALRKSKSARKLSKAYKKYRACELCNPPEIIKE